MVRLSAGRMSTTTRQFLYSALVLSLGLGAGSVLADSSAPATLHMRSHRTVNVDKARKVQQARPLRLAQTPDPNQPPAPDPGAPPAPDPTKQAEPAPPPPPAEPAPPPNVG